jgi:ATP synthase protein I
MLRGAALPAAVVGVVLTAVSAIFGGHVAAGCAVGSAVAVVAVLVGPVVMRTFAQHSPPAVMAAAVSSYFLTVLVLGLVYKALGPVTWLSQASVGVALIVCVLASMAGQAWAVWHLRLPAYGPDGGAGGSAESAGQPAKQGAPHTRGD